MRSHESEHEAPWTEEQWEEFMKTADLRAARYSELMETLIDDPQRDDIIDHEMGWDRKRGAVDQEWIEEIAQAAAEAIESGEDIIDQEARQQDPGELLPESTPQIGKNDDFFDESDRQLHRIPAYHLAETLSHKIDAALDPLMNVEGQEADEDVAQAYIQVKIASAKIAGGHGMGYEDEVIGGNVVNCKRALAAADECALALQALSRRRLLPEDAIAPLLDQLAGVRKAIENRISELRSRMWWQQR